MKGEALPCKRKVGIRYPDVYIYRYIHLMGRLAGLGGATKFSLCQERGETKTNISFKEIFQTVWQDAGKV